MPHIGVELNWKRKLMVLLIGIHLALILFLIAITGFRRVFLALFVNLGFTITLLLGLLFFGRLSLDYGKCFIVTMPVIIVLAVVLMLVEALTLYEPDSHDRYFTFFVNIPIIIDLAFAVAYCVIYYRHLQPLYMKAKEKQALELPRI